MRRAGAIAVLLLLPALLAAQRPPRPVYRSGVDMVDVAVVVTDDEGRFVPGLAATDFQVSERGVAQKITVFDRVSIPIWRRTAGALAPEVPSDVSSNERPGDGRLFVLVLDALHVAPANLSAVRQQARRFVEDHVGPSDLVAVVSPGALAAATQDFTADKARLAAAIDRFSGSKLRSATLEIEEERLFAVVGGGENPSALMPHGGKDPSDAERAYRAESLASVLEALSEHLERVAHRRKAVLLFSEGIDYNTADLMGSVQARASDVQRAMAGAVGALMRANVSLYAIDPRGLASADTAGEKIPYRPAPNAPRPDGTLPKLDLSEPSLEAEYTNSITSLRAVSDPTGGFAFVAGNDPGKAFDRIVRESSDYYVIGYAPSTKRKAGEFQPIDVRVNRAGVRVIARNGYVVPSALVPAAPAPSAEPAPDRKARLGFDRPARAEAAPVEAAPPAVAPRGLHDELAWLLSSPLPVEGLPIRVQAAPFRGTGKGHVVQVVTEVLGAPLAFAERAGRFESRIELASFTIDERGRGANGRSTTIDLRLTRSEYEQVRASGIRWMSQLDLPPGRHQLRVAARAPATGAVGMVTTEVQVPAFAGERALSGVALASVAAAAMVTRGEARLVDALGAPPTAERTFVAGDRVTAAVEVYVQDPGPVSGVVARIEGIDNDLALERLEKLPERARPGTTAAVSVPIDTATLPPGRYILRMRLEPETGAPDAERRVAFTIIHAP